MNTACCEDLSSLLEAAHALIAYRNLLDKWLHGTETEDVLLGGVLTPTLRKLIAMISDRGTTQAPYEICEFYHFRKPTLRPGFQPCQGGVIKNAATKYPEAWAYLQTEEGQLLCKSEAEWQAMTQATWGDGSFKASWNGIGGAPYFVQNLEAGTLRMPDLRGMFACATDSTLAVGQAQGDCIRNATGNIYGVVHKGALGYHGIMYSRVSSPSEYIGMNGLPSYHLQPGSLSTNLSAGIPTGPVITPKSWGTLVCAYLGQPAAA